MNELLLQLQKIMVEGDQKQVGSLVEACLKEGISSMEIINNGCMPGMDEVGRLFSEGELFLPNLLISGRMMKSVIDDLQPYLGKDASAEMQLGRVVIGTVQGDVHDIGKNLVKTILENNGFSVIDLGKQVPADQIIDEAIEKKVTAIGLSALLVNTSQQMPIIVEKLRANNSKIPVLIGGAAVNQTFAGKIAKDENGSVYAGGVFYCRDAFDALTVLDGLDSYREGFQ